MGFSLTRFGSFMAKGLSLFTPDFTADYSLAITSTNMLSGIRQGMGPRFGMTPIPGHCHIAAKTWSGGVHGLVPAGLMHSEGSAYAFQSRTRFFGVYPLRLNTAADGTISKTFFAWIVGTATELDVGIGSEQTSYTGGFAICSPSSDIVAGIPRRNVDALAEGSINIRQNTVILFSLKSQTVPAPSLSAALTWDKYYLASAVSTISGKDVPQNNFVGKVITQGSATVTPLPNFVYGSNNFGIPSWINSKNYPSGTRTVFLSSVINGSGSNEGGLVAKYQYDSVSWDSTTTIPAFNGDISVAQLNLGTATAVSGRSDAVVLNPAATAFVFVNDQKNITNSAYTAILLADKQPIACVLQPWLQAGDGSINQWVDLTDHTFYSRKSKLTEYEISPANTPINPIVKQSCWNEWFRFTRGAVYPYVQNYALTKFNAYTVDGTIGNQIAFGENGSGILRGGQVYEFTFSMYNKRLNFESNVGDPAKLQIPWNFDAFSNPGTAHTVDYVAVTLFQQQSISGTGVLCNLHAAADRTYTGSAPQKYHTVFSLRLEDLRWNNLNETEYRVYYRQEGSFEWLPAGAIDAAEYWYNPSLKAFWICTGDASGLPGGQPGGFNDYSCLPKDQYTSVLQWRSRVFWLSSKSLIFSMINNIFAYPLRNSVTCPTGEFRGAIVHAFPGQSTQEGRLIIFGSEEVYIGRFTGNPSMYPVQVSPTTTGTFPLDGSDFVVERWSTMTAFSSRAAVVADGELYYWGPKGIFHDNGTELPDRISADLEPAMFTLYNPNRTDEIFAHYFSETKEIFWFFPVRDTTVRTTSALVVNTLTGQFGFCSFNSQIDSISECNIERTDTTRAIGGIRRIASVRADADATLQRAYFFDVRNKTGDLEPTKDIMIKGVNTATTAGQVRLTLAEGADYASANAIVAGDKILVGQYQDYSGRTDFIDFLGTVVYKNITNASPVTGYYDVKLPAALPATSFNVTLAANNYTPIWSSRHNTFSWALNGNYWAPQGLNTWAYWQFLHHQYKVALIADDAGGPTVNIASRTPISKTSVTRASVLVDNSDGNCQIYSQLLPTDQAFEGQAIKLAFSGTYLGHDWTMQYLGVDASFLPEGDFLRMFEG